jgi:putative SOS response-associated peptidase YedK
MLEQSVKALGIRFQARIQLDLFEELFRRRLVDDRLKLPKAMEADFLEPTSQAEQRIRQAILDYRQAQGQKLHAELLRQQERLARAERSLAQRATKSVVAEQRIAKSKIAWVQAKLDDLVRDRPEPRDARIFPQWYAPVVSSEGGECIVRPMRYHLRPSGKPASIDQKFDGLYNARRDSLTGFWRGQFGAQHAIVVVTSFFENVARHDYEHRPLSPGERSENLVVHFQPAPSTESETPPEMTVACVWDHWVGSAEPELWSFAAITDTPPPEVSATGHDRCVVALRAQHVALWLTPEGRRDEELFRLLTDRAPYFYRHRLAG